MKIIVGILFVALCLAFTIFSRGCCGCRERAEQAMAEAAKGALGDTYPGIRVRPDHFGLNLDGTVGTEAEKSAAEDKVRATLPKFGKLHSNLTVAEPVALLGSVSFEGIPEDTTLIDADTFKELGLAEGAPWDDSMPEKLAAHLRSLTGVGDASVASSATPTGYDLLATITPAAPKIAGIEIVPQRGGIVDKDAVSAALGLSAGDPFEPAALAPAAVRIEALDSVLSATVESFQSPEGIGIRALVTPLPPAPKLLGVEIGGDSSLTPSASTAIKNFLAEQVPGEAGFGQPLRSTDLPAIARGLADLPEVHRAEVTTVPTEGGIQLKIHVRGQGIVSEPSTNE